jgi:hypothetical protein
MYVTTKGVKFEIITTNDEIMFLDEAGDSLTWDNNDDNMKLVDDMIKSISG